MLSWSGWASGWEGFWNPIGSNPAIEAAVGSLVIVFYEITAIFILLALHFYFCHNIYSNLDIGNFSPFAFACYILPATRKFSLSGGSNLSSGQLSE